MILLEPSDAWFNVWMKVEQKKIDQKGDFPEGGGDIKPELGGH